MSDKYIGRKLDDRYEIVEVIGTGAMGAVFKGIQVAVDRTVAIKLLHPFLKEREEFKARFELEAKAIARLNHPNCITLYDFGYDADLDVFYMVVEYLEGVPLADRMYELLPIDDVLSIIYQVADALEHAHAQGILHRDLKPENIMLVPTSSGRDAVKVLDFGLAKLYADSDGARISKAGELFGTPAYMSPEQSRGELDLTPATDIYSLGVLMFELFEGHLPFFADSTTEILLKHLNDPVPELVSGRVPLPIEHIIYDMLAKDPRNRVSSAREVAAVLTDFVQLDVSREFGASRSGEFRARQSGEYARTSGEFAARRSGEYARTSGEFATRQSGEYARTSGEFMTRQSGEYARISGEYARATGEFPTVRESGMPTLTNVPSVELEESPFSFAPRTRSIALTAVVAACLSIVAIVAWTSTDDAPEAGPANPVAPVVTPSPVDEPLPEDSKEGGEEHLVQVNEAEEGDEADAFPEEKRSEPKARVKRPATRVKKNRPRKKESSEASAEESPDSRPKTLKLTY